jgi:hypothetical protein
VTISMWTPVDRCGAWMSRHHRFLWGLLIAAAAAFAWAVRLGWIS